MTLTRRLALPGLGLLAALLASGCPNITPEAVAVGRDELADLDDIADLSTDPDIGAAFLDEAADPGTGAGRKAASVSNPATQDVAGSYKGPFPTDMLDASMFDVAAGPSGSWLATNPGMVDLPRSVMITHTWLVAKNADKSKPPFAAERMVMRDSDMIEHQVVGLEATGSAADTHLPDLFKALVPATASVATAQLSWHVFEKEGQTASGTRWVVYDPQSPGRAIVAWIRAFQISRNAQKIDHYDVATGYAPQASGKRLPLEIITDDYNETTRARRHEDLAYDQSVSTWRGTGTLTTASGNTRDVTSTWNTNTGEASRQVTATVKHKQIVIKLAAAADRSGTGTVEVSGEAVGTLIWDKTGQGTATLKNGKTRKIRIHGAR